MGGLRHGAVDVAFWVPRHHHRADFGGVFGFLGVCRLQTVGLSLNIRLTVSDKTDVGGLGVELRSLFEWLAALLSWWF